MTINTLFFNTKAELTTDYERDFYLFHELRHAEQYSHREKFSPEIQKSLDYVVMYNGECYRLSENKWKECKLSGGEEFFTKAYLSLPYEIDANEHAFAKCMEIYPEEKDKVLPPGRFVSAAAPYR